MSKIIQKIHSEELDGILYEFTQIYVCSDKKWYKPFSEPNSHIEVYAKILAYMSPSAKISHQC